MVEVGDAVYVLLGMRQGARNVGRFMPGVVTCVQDEPRYNVLVVFPDVTEPEEGPKKLIETPGTGTYFLWVNADDAVPAVAMQQVA